MRSESSQAVITLLTDFGTADSYVAEMKGALLSGAPDITIIDISHHVPPGDVRAGQYLLSRAWRHFPEGSVHLAVIDPGVGTERRLIAAESSGHRFVAPDNGLLSFLAQGTRFVSLPIPSGAAPTFQGRDVIAPAAIQLATGAKLESLGVPIGQPHQAPLPVPRTEGTAVVGEVIYVDRFGTLISNIGPARIKAGARIYVAGKEVGTLRRTFADASRGAPVAFVGSGETVEIAVRDGRAAEQLKVGVGAEIRVC